MQKTKQTQVWKKIRAILSQVPKDIQDLPERFVSSAKELKSVKTLAVCAMMLAVGTILGYFSIKLDNDKTVGISVIAPQLVSALYGPVVGGIVGATGDILDWLLHPHMGPFFPGYTLNAFLGQMIYGMVLYKKNLSLLRIVVSKVLVAVLVNLPLGSLWSWIFVNKGYLAILVGKIAQQGVQIVVLGVLFYMFVSALKNAKVFQKLLNK